MKSLEISPMEYFTERVGSVGKCIKIAEELFQNKIWLHSNIFYKPITENIFDTVFETDITVKREYLFSMDYLSALLSVYRENRQERYLKKFLDVVGQFFEYYERGMFFPVKEDDLIVCAQTLMFIKAFSIVEYEESLKNKIIALLYRYAVYCRDNNNHQDDNNHGLFTDLALLHLSVLFEKLSEAEEWRMHAVRRIHKLFEDTFYKDGVNKEGSLSYFRFNLSQYQSIMEFCKVYEIPGMDMIIQKIGFAKQIFCSFARSDGSYPIIGDGVEMVLKEHNDISALYPEAGICVVKTGQMYLTFKCKGIVQAHTHVDDTSITARFQAFDLVLDSGQYNYDRYHPINRYLRTSGGHSGIFPLFADSLGLKEYLKRCSFSGIDKFDFDGSICCTSGGYELDGGAIKVRRDITIKPERIEVHDKWICKTPQNMRQRFVIPGEFIETSRFTASQRVFETKADKYTIKYEITSETTPIVTTVNFGVLSRRYGDSETTVLLDTIAENSVSGEITAVITVRNGKNE